MFVEVTKTVQKVSFVLARTDVWSAKATAIVKMLIEPFVLPIDVPSVSRSPFEPALRKVSMLVSRERKLASTVKIGALARIGKGVVQGKSAKREHVFQTVLHRPLARKMRRPVLPRQEKCRAD